MNYHNANDLSDIANQCEQLLNQLFSDSTTLSIFPYLLKVTIFTKTGCLDLLSFLLAGFLESNIYSVHINGYYDNSSIFVRLFISLFHSNSQLQAYLINSESDSGSVLIVIICFSIYGIERLFLELFIISFCVCFHTFHFINSLIYLKVGNTTKMIICPLIVIGQKSKN